MAFKIVGDPPRLVSDAKLTPADFAAIARQLGVKPFRARKTGYVAARPAKPGEAIETHWNGKETVNTAKAGDWIVTSLAHNGKPMRDRDGNENAYVVPGHRFDELYESAEAKQAAPKRRTLGATYRPKGSVSALPLDGGFDIVAPWGERQTATAGFLLLNGNEVYGNNAETFAETYSTSKS